MLEVPATWTLRSSPRMKEAGPIGIGGAGGCGSLTVERALSCETGDRGRPRRETPRQRVDGFGSWRHQPTNSLFAGSQPSLTPSLRATSKMCEAHKGDSMVQRGSERCTTVNPPRSSSERPGNPCEMPRFGTLGDPLKSQHMRGGHIRLDGSPMLLGMCGRLCILVVSSGRTLRR